MKNLKLFFLLFLATLIASPTHAVTSYTKTSGFMTEEELIASLDAYVKSLPTPPVQNVGDNNKQPSTTTPQDDASQAVLDADNSNTREPSSQNVGAFAGGDNNKKARSKNICETCGKHFQKPSALKRHIRTHTGEKPFECDVCKLRFSENGNRKRHMQKQHQRK